LWHVVLESILINQARYASVSHQKRSAQSGVDQIRAKQQTRGPKTKKCCTSKSDQHGVLNELISGPRRLRLYPGEYFRFEGWICARSCSLATHRRHIAMLLKKKQIGDSAAGGQDKVCTERQINAFRRASRLFGHLLEVAP
jgi:hypothetical protein